jgi:hypothetical protein
MNGDIDAYHDPMDMLREATQYLERVRQTLIEADRFKDILRVRSAGELYRQYAGQRRYGTDIQNIGAEIKEVTGNNVKSTVRVSQIPCQIASTEVRRDRKRSCAVLEQQ